MASQTIVFDPTAGVPVGANLSIYGGSGFNADFSIVDTEALHMILLDLLDHLRFQRVLLLEQL